MPLRGGASDKLGNRYEARWTAQCFADVLSGDATGIWLEPPGPDGEGIELILRRPAGDELHQVKRQAPEGRWTVSRLRQEEVLKRIQERLDREPSATFIFVSGHAADQVNELCENARASESLEQFRQDYLPQGSRQDNLTALATAWGCTPDRAYSLLRRLEVRTVDEETLRRMLCGRLSGLVDGNSQNVLDVLAQHALDKVGQNLDATGLWNHLTSRGFQRRRWDRDPAVTCALDTATARYSSLLRGTALLGSVLHRPETDDIKECLKDRELVVLAGEAGAGKSFTLLQIVDDFKASGCPTFAFRVDRARPTASPEELGKDLGLPGSPPDVLGAVAGDRDSLLVIDQLDAVSIASGRHPEFFDCIADIVLRARSYKRMRVLLACRAFDLENDWRLRALVAAPATCQVKIGALARESVSSVLTKLRLPEKKLTEKQLSLLSLPANLALLAEVVTEADTQVVPTFETQRDLFELFWDRKQRAADLRLGRSSRWTEVIDRLCDQMSKNQTLWASRTILDDLKQDADALASEGVLVGDNDRWAFTHEGLFDYAFARRFADRYTTRDLLKGEQHLFRRSQLRQLLIHKRQGRPDEYAKELTWLVTSPSVRFHIKKMVFSLLRDVADPKVEEWNVLADLLSRGKLEDHVWSVFRGQPPWFHLLDREGVFEAMLAYRRTQADLRFLPRVRKRFRFWVDSARKRDPAPDHPETTPINRVIEVLSSAQRTDPDRVAELLEPYAGRSSEWNKRIRFVTNFADLESGTRFFNLFLRLIDLGALDDARGRGGGLDFGMTLHQLGRANPERAATAWGHFFRRRLVIADEQSLANPFDGAVPDLDHRSGELEVAARGAPSKFLEEVLPFVLEVCRRASHPSEPEDHGVGLQRDRVWRFRMHGGHNFRQAILHAVELSLHALAEKDPEAAASVARRLVGEPYETMNFLFLRAVRASGTLLADDCVGAIIASPARLASGYSDSPMWAAREAIESASPHCSEPLLRQLEALLLDYYPERERDADARQYRGYAQLVLLPTISEARRSESVRRRIDELRRKFGEAEERARPQGIRGGYVVSPIPEESVERLTNQAWIHAMSEHATPDVRGGSWLRGGLAEIAGQIERLAQSQPERMATLASEMPTTLNPAYFDAILRGLAKSKCAPELVVRSCMIADQLPSKPCGRWICSALGEERVAGSPLDAAVLAAVSWYSQHDPDPESDREPDESEDESGVRGLLTQGINTTRGEAGMAIARLIWGDPARLKAFEAPLRALSQDRSMAVRSCAAEALLAAFVSDESFAVAAFEQLATGSELLLGTRPVEILIHHAVRKHPAAILPTIARMVRSTLPHVSRAGGRRACVASLSLAEALPLAAACLRGSEEQRVGAAQVYARNIASADFESVCRRALEKLLNDSSEKVREAAADFVSTLPRDNLRHFEQLIHGFISCPAFREHHRVLFEALLQTPERLPDATLAACERFVRDLRTEASSPAHHAAMEVDDVAALLLRLYVQSDAALQSRCLDLMDDMLRFDLYRAESALTHDDR